jgi:hypothetical protein
MSLTVILWSSGRTSDFTVAYNWPARAESCLVAGHARRSRRHLIKIVGRDTPQGGNGSQLAAFADYCLPAVDQGDAGAVAEEVQRLYVAGVVVAATRIESDENGGVVGIGRARATPGVYR